jgi:hypothetical protein
LSLAGDGAWHEPARSQLMYGHLSLNPMRQAIWVSGDGTRPWHPECRHAKL